VLSRKAGPDKPARHIVIRTSADAEQLARSDVPLALFGAPAIALTLPLPPESLQGFQTAVDRLTSTCGCLPSAIVMLLILAPALICIWTMDVVGTYGTNRWLLSVGTIVLATLVGLAVKYAVIARARHRLRRLLLLIAGSETSNRGG
jgi:hypothetical protein